MGMPLVTQPGPPLRDNARVDDAGFMAHAARLAREGVAKGEGGPFGAVVVKDGRVVGASCNRVLATNDPTAHAEVLAIREASRALGAFHLDGCVLYTTCEPCPMCLAAAHWAHVARIVYAQTRDDAARIGFDDAAIHAAMGAPLVPMEIAPHPEAAAAFDEWRDKPDKTPY
jgi:tRNA(Arg) A34 adenosine deaminase TadA